MRRQIWLTLASVSLLAGALFARSGPETSAGVLARGTMPEGLRVSRDEPTEFAFQRVALQPGAATGWHTHPGPLLVIVARGTLTRFEADCSFRRYAAGDAFTEPGGEIVHEGRNLGSEPVELWITYVLAPGSALRADAPSPACATLSS